MVGVEQSIGATHVKNGGNDQMGGNMNPFLPFELINGVVGFPSSPALLVLVLVPAPALREKVAEAE